MLFPLGDDNPRRSTPVVTIALIAVNALVFFANNLGADDEQLHAFAMRWGYDSSNPFGVQILTSMFMHGNLLHIAGNMWVLWIVGDNVEDKLGKVRYLLFYLIGGIVAAWSYSFIANLADPPAGVYEALGREHPPLVGASGAVYAVMGMYVVFFPEARIRMLAWFFLFVQTFRISAKWFIGVTIALDFLQTLLARGPANGGVATAAHVGGGVFGIVTALSVKGWIGGRGDGDAWDVHTGFAKQTRDGTEATHTSRPRPGPAAGRGGDAWFAPPEPMEDRAAELEGALVELVHAGRMREAIDVYPGYVALRRERPLPPEVQIEIAHEFYRQGLAKDGIAAYRRFVDTNPDDDEAPEAAFRIGLLYARGLGDAKSAVPWLRQAARTHANPEVVGYAERELMRLGA
jgi:membrane associated rhomboid family serine protease